MHRVSPPQNKGQSQGGASSSTDERFDRLYADAARRKEKRQSAAMAQHAHHTYRPEIAHSQAARAGGMGGAKRFEALFEESAQRNMKLQAKQHEQRSAAQRQFFKPRVVPNRSGELVKGLVQKGKLNPDATARLHQAAPSSVQKVKAKEKLKLEYAVANCTFKPELCSGESSHQSREGRLEERNEGKIEAMMTNEEESLLPQPSPPPFLTSTALYRLMNQ